MNDIHKSLLIGLSSRILVIVVVVVASVLFGVSSAQPAAHEINPVPIANLFNRFDSGFYMGIASHGYPTGYPDISFWTAGGHYINTNIANPVLANPDWAFFPLYPLVIKAVSLLFIILPATNAIELAGFVVSNLFFFIAVFFMYKLTNRIFDSSKLAIVATAFFSFFGGAVFYSAIYSESLFMALALAAFYYLEEDKLPIAVVLGFLAAFTRSDGFIVAIPFLFYAIQSARNKPKTVRLVTCSALVASPFLIFQGIGYMLAGHVFPITLVAHNLNFAIYPVLTSQLVQVLSWKLLVTYCIGLALIFLPTAYSIGRAFAGSIKLSVLQESRQLKYWALYTAIALIIIFMSGIASIIRYAVPMLPIYWVSALIYKKNRLAGIVIFVIMTALFVVGSYMLEIGSDFM